MWIWISKNEVRDYCVKKYFSALEESMVSFREILNCILRTRYFRVFGQVAYFLSPGWVLRPFAQGQGWERGGC